MSYEMHNSKENFETRYIFAMHRYDTNTSTASPLLFYLFICIFHPTTLAAMAGPDTNISPPSHRAITENMKENVKVLNNILHKTQHKIAKHR